MVAFKVISSWKAEYHRTGKTKIKAFLIQPNEMFSKCALNFFGVTRSCSPKAIDNNTATPQPRRFAVIIHWYQVVVLGVLKQQEEASFSPVLLVKIIRSSGTMNSRTDSYCSCWVLVCVFCADKLTQTRPKVEIRANRSCLAQNDETEGLKDITINNCPCKQNNCIVVLGAIGDRRPF